MDFDESVDTFLKQVGDMLIEKAQSKGYAGNNGGRDLFDSVDSECPGHAAGEIRYKIKRWQAKKNPEDLIKIAAWAFLIWDQDARLSPSDEPIKAGSIINNNCTHPYNLQIGAGIKPICARGDCRCKCDVCLMTHGG
jgi:hypothetical protein